MKKICALAAAAAILLISSAALAASAKTYQVTGEVVMANEDMIVVMKGNERWEVSRDAGTKMPDNIQVGDKVTITYRMHAASVETKAKSTKATKTSKKTT